MSHDRKAIDAARRKGAFRDNVFDPRALELSEEEKARLRREFARIESEQKAGDQAEAKGRRHSAKKDGGSNALAAHLNFFEKIVVFILSLVGVNPEEYRRNKAVHAIEKAVARIRPPIYNASAKRVTKFLGYRVYDLYLKLFTLKKIYARTVSNPPLWTNTQRLQKSGVEILFEKLMNVNSRDLDERFSYQGVLRTVSEYDSMNRAAEAVDAAARAYLDSLDKNAIETANKAYTNVVYFQQLIEFDYLQFFRRFDPAYNTGGIPNFTDIFGDAIADYLAQLEEAVLQVDLSLGDLGIFHKLEETARMLDMQSQSEEKAGDDAVQIEGTGEKKDESAGAKLESDLVLLFEILKDFIQKNTFTLLNRIIRRDPAYAPNFLRARHDLHKLYFETFTGRVRNALKESVRTKKRQKIEENIRKSFNVVQSVGVYNANLSGKLEENGFLGFAYAYPVGVVQTFLKSYYDEIIQDLLNTFLMSGVFADKHFQKTMSETYYEMEKYQQKFREFCAEVSQDGPTAKKIMNELARHDLTAADHKKTVDRLIVGLNSRAKELYEQFYGLFSGIADILGKIHSDIEAKPPKFVRNIHSVSGLKTTRLLNYVANMTNILSSVKESLGLLRE